MSGRSDDATYRTGGADIDWRESGGEVIVLARDSSLYFGLNHTGAALWKALVQGATRAELIDALLAAGATSRTTAAGEVDSFLDELEDAGLLYTGPEASTPAT